MPPSTSFCRNCFLWKWSLQWVVDRVWGLWVSATQSILELHWDSSNHGDPAALVLQDHPLHMLYQPTGRVDVGVGHLKVLDLDLSGNWMVQTPTSPAPVSLRPALPNCSGNGQGQLTHACFLLELLWGGQWEVGPAQHSIGSSTGPQTVTQATYVHMAFHGNTGYWHQPRSLLR